MTWILRSFWSVKISRGSMKDHGLGRCGQPLPVRVLRILRFTGVSVIDEGDFRVASVIYLPLERNAWNMSVLRHNVSHGYLFRLHLKSDQWQIDCGQISLIFTNTDCNNFIHFACSRCSLHSRLVTRRRITRVKTSRE